MRPKESATGTAIVVKTAPGRPDLVQVSIDAALAPPERAMFADHVQVENVRDGVRMLFGKLHPTKPNLCSAAVEVSFPPRSFVSHLCRSVEASRPEGSFHEVVEKAAKRFGYGRIDSLGRAEFDRVQAFRSNFVYMALHDDDAAIDFFHLDAATMQLALQGAAQGGHIAPDFRGILRIVVSPALLLYFLDACVHLGQELKTANPELADLDEASAP